VPQLLDGIEVVTVAVGLFAVGETLWTASKDYKAVETMNAMRGSVWMTAQDWKRSWGPWLRGTAIGFPFGAMPAGGAEIPTFLSYAIEKKLTKHPEEFGQGAIEGVAGPEAANNASSTGTMTTLLALGLPTSATAAILLAAFQQYGLQPGPLLFVNSADLVWALIASMYVGNIMLLVLNLPLVGIWVKLLKIPKPMLYAGILIFATLGVFGMRQSAFDIFLLYAIGLLGFLMRRYDFPTAPVIIGMILGPLAEAQLRRSLSISQGDWLVFLQKPLSASLLAITAAMLIGPWAWKKLRQA
jgi:putative tricarboxylic transport membrane protein